MRQLENAMTSLLEAYCVREGRNEETRGRNTEADDFLREMLPLKKELAAIGNNVNQAVRKLHIRDKIPEFRSWLTEYEGLKKLLMNKVEEIRLRMNQPICRKRRT